MEEQPTTRNNPLSDAIKFIDPAGTLVAGMGAAAILTRARAASDRPRLVGTVLLSVLCVMSLAATAVLARDMLADRELRRFRDGLARALLPLDALVHARRHLEQGVLRWRPDHAIAWYRLGALRYQVLDLFSVTQLPAIQVHVLQGFSHLG